MSNASLLILAPAGNYSHSGILDQSLELAVEMRTVHDVNTKVVAIGASADVSHNVINSPTQVYYEYQALGDFLRDLHPSTYVLTQYAYGGFGRSPLPVGLLRFLRHLPRRRKAVFFHEIFVSPRHRLTKANVLKQSQLSLARKLISSCSFAATNTPKWHSALMPVEASVRLIPTASNFGCEAPVSALERNSLVIFGQEERREKCAEALALVCSTFFSKWRPSRIIEIGAGNSIFADLCGIPVTFLGRADRSTVADVLRRSRVGLFAGAYPDVMKSSVFASYAAYGVAPIRAEQLHPLGEDPREAISGIGSGSPKGLTSSELDQIGLTCFRWYTENVDGVLGNELSSWMRPN